MPTSAELSQSEQRRLVGQVKDFLDAVPVFVILVAGIMGVIVGINLGVADGTFVAIGGTSAGGVVVHCLSRLVINRTKRGK